MDLEYLSFIAIVLRLHIALLQISLLLPALVYSVVLCCQNFLINKIYIYL